MVSKSNKGLSLFIYPVITFTLLCYYTLFLGNASEGSSTFNIVAFNVIVALPISLVVWIGVNWTKQGMSMIIDGVNKRDMGSIIYSLVYILPFPASLLLILY